MSYGDLTKSIDDLIGKKAFSMDKSFTVKSKTSSGVTLKGENKITGKGATSTVSGKFKMDNGINFTKVEASTTGKFKVEAELANAFDGLCFTFATLVGSEASNVNESAKVGFGYTGVKNLDFNADLDFMGSAMTLTSDACYAVSDNIKLGGDLGFKFASFLGGAGEATNTGLSDYSVGLAYSTGDFEFALKVGQPGSPSDAAANNLSAGFFHKCSGTTSWGATLAQSGKGSFSSRGINASIGGETALAGDSTATYKVNQNAVGSFKLAQKVNSSMKLTFQSQIDFANLGNDQSFGVGIELNN